MRPFATKDFVAICSFLPEGIRGQYRVEYFSVTDAQARFSCTLGHGYVEPGTYTRLCFSMQTLMSDTPDEKRTNLEIMRIARGNVLIAGLGIGMILWPMLDFVDVTSVDVVERSEDVIQLVTPHILQHPNAHKLRVIHGNIFDVVEDKKHHECWHKYDIIYFDIWEGWNEDFYEELQALRRRCRWMRSTECVVLGWNERRMKASVIP